MHPELLGALARLSTDERTREVRTPASPAMCRQDRLVLPRALRRARRQLGSMLLDVGLHLMVAT